MDTLCITNRNSATGKPLKLRLMPKNIPLKTYSADHAIKSMQLVIMGMHSNIHFRWNWTNILRLICFSYLKNSIGAGEASDILNTRTKGSKPIMPENSKFIEPSSNSVTLHLPTWKDGSCRMSHFVVEHKKKYGIFDIHQFKKKKKN